MITLTRAEKNNATIASAPIKAGKLKLKIEGHDRYYDFYYAEEGGDWQLLAKGVDASNLSTQKSGGFIGACIGSLCFFQQGIRTFKYQNRKTP